MYTQRSHRKISSDFMTVVLVAMLLFGVAIAPANAQSANGPGADGGVAALVGTWHGVIDIPGQPLDVKLVFVEQAAGGVAGTIDIPVQGAFGLRLDPVEIDGDEVRFALVDIPAFVTGTLVDGSSRIDGDFHQSGMAFPFRAEREVTEDAEPAPAPKGDVAEGDTGSTDSPQLADVRTFIEQALADWQVPGAAVVIVQDGEIVMAEGFGLRDVERELPVTPHTRFGIGSSTKAFTATAFQMLVDEGALSWGQPLRELIPGFRLADKFASEHATALDFALHRSGLPRHDILWMANSDLDANTLIAAAEQLQPSAGFREGWMYNNFGYVLLGHLIEQADGRAWAEFVTERLLQPLGMDETNFTIADLLASDDFSLAYAAAEEGWDVVPLSELGAAGPAGAINSNAVDMGKWLLLQLSDGRVGDEQLVSGAGMANLRTPHISMGGPEDEHINFSSYGLGWMIDSYRGHYRVHHGGNTIGFSADVAFIPGKNVGVAVLTNGLFTPLPTVIVHHVLDALLGLEPVDWSGDLLAVQQLQAAAMQQSGMDGGEAQAGRRAGTTPSHDLAEYEGTYAHPAYGTLNVALSGEQLSVTYYDLQTTLEHWHFDQFRGQISPYIPMEFPFVFETDGAGEIAKVYVGFEPTVDPIPFVRRAADGLTEREYLQQFVGDYDLMGATIDVSYRNDALVLTVPGQPPYVLEPTREGQFVFRDFEGFGVHFTFSDEGDVEKALLIQPHGNVELPRK